MGKGKLFIVLMGCAMLGMGCSMNRNIKDGVKDSMKKDEILLEENKLKVNPDSENSIPDKSDNTIRDSDSVKENEIIPEDKVNIGDSEVVKNMTEVTNPLIWADVPDPDLIRVGDYYYMVSTTMHLSPGVPLMRSKDLAHWELISYVYEELSDHASYQLKDGKNVYGRGSWAASLRYYKGIYYVCFASLDRGITYIYQTDSIENGTWSRTAIPELFHDPSLLFDDDGKVYIVHGNGNIRIRELKEDLTGVKPGGVDQILINTAREGNIVNSEGCHIYKINGTYYIIMIEWPRTGSGRRIEWCYRSETLLGEYEGRIVLDDNFWYGNNGVAQGGIVDTPEGDWYAILFQDHGAVGRIPMLMPVTWTDGWPMMGVDGKVPPTMEILTDESIITNIVANDEFDYIENKLKLQWQWNHNPDHNLWSVTDRPGFLRLTTGTVVSNILSARNTLSQRTVGPIFNSEIKLDTSGMKPGDYAGIAAFQSGYGMLGVKVERDGKKNLIVASNDGTGNPKEEVVLPLEQEEVYLKINFFFNAGDIKRLTVFDKAYFYYSYDGEKWLKLDYSLPMKYTLDHFMGYRAALFNYATMGAGGYADFDYYRISNVMK